jgi:hypothetical protein
MVFADVLARRALDPYKKLDQVVYDINELDIELIRRDVLSVMFPDSAIEKSSAPEDFKKDEVASAPEKKEIEANTLKYTAPDGTLMKNKKGENMEQLKARGAKEHPETEKASAPESSPETSSAGDFKPPIDDPDDIDQTKLEEETLV